MIVKAYGEYRTETYEDTEEDGKPIICKSKSVGWYFLGLSQSGGGDPRLQ